MSRSRAASRVGASTSKSSDQMRPVSGPVAGALPFVSRITELHDRLVADVHLAGLEPMVLRAVA